MFSHGVQSSEYPRKEEQLEEALYLGAAESAGWLKLIRIHFFFFATEAIKHDSSRLRDLPLTEPGTGLKTKPQTPKERYYFRNMYFCTLISPRGRNICIFFSKDAMWLARNNLPVSLCASSINKCFPPYRFPLGSSLPLDDSKFPVKSVCATDAEEPLSERNSSQTMDNHYPLWIT